VRSGNLRSQSVMPAFHLILGYQEKTTVVPSAAVTVSTSLSGHTLRQIAVGPLLQHNAARAHAGFVRGLTSANVFAEYLLYAFAECERVRRIVGTSGCGTQLPGGIR
jgi:hypothetical protein